MAPARRRGYFPEEIEAFCLSPVAVLIVAIDGPASSGKSTTARAVARRLGGLYLDTGAMYRALALAFLRAEEEPTPEGAARLLPEVAVRVSHTEGEMRVALGEEDVSEEIRTQAVGEMASRISALPAVREKLVEAQRAAAHAHEAEGKRVVLDGRDIGTVVFPEADVKIFVVAEARERARRRQAELAERGEDVSLDAVQDEIEARDRKDRERALAPLKKADGAVVLDTTLLSVEEQVAFVVERVRERERGSAG